MSQADRPKPYQPRGAINGKVCDTTMAKNMSFVAIYGNSCGTPFYKDVFCREHREWAHLQPYLHDRLREPWVKFTTTDNYGSAVAVKGKNKVTRKGARAALKKMNRSLKLRN
jgi:hypothetical protein